MSQALTEIMALVDDLAGAKDETAKMVATSLILLRLCPLTGDDARAEMERRRAPCAPLKVPSHQRAVKAPRRMTAQQASCKHDFIGDTSKPGPLNCTLCGLPLFEGESLEQVVEAVAEKLELKPVLRVVPVHDEVGGGEVPWGEEAGT